MAYHGDIRLSDTIDILFASVAATGAPTQLAGSPVISAYVGNSLTQITAGITLSVDFDGLTGLNNVRVVATGANGYATATNVRLVITTGTVGGVSVVGYPVGSFSIENRSALMPATPGRTAVVDAAGLVDANTVKVGPSGFGTAQTTGDIPARLPTALTVDGWIKADTLRVGGVLQTSGDIIGDTNAIQAKTDNLPSDPADASVVAGLIAALEAKVDTVDTVVDAILVDTGTTLDGRIPAALVNGLMQVDVVRIAATVQSPGDVYNLLTTVQGQVGRIIRDGTAQAGAAGTITLDGSASAVDDFYNNTLVQVFGGTGAGQARFIRDYVGATKVATVSRNWATTPDNTSTFIIWPLASVLDALLADHAIVGSAGAGISAAGSAGDPWATALPGAYGAGTAGKVVGDNLDATISSRATAAALATVDGIVDDILIDTAEIGAAGAGLTNINLPNQTMDIIGNITGNLSGSVGSVTGAVGSVTGAVGSVTGAVGSIATGGIAAASFAAGAIDAAAIAADAIGASELAASAVTEIQSGLSTSAALSTLQTSVDDLPTNAELATSQAAADDATLAAVAGLTIPTGNQNAAALLDLADAIEVGLTLRQATRLQVAALAGELSGAATTTVVIRNAVADSKDRITATVDANGNRTAVTTDLTT